MRAGQLRHKVEIHSISESNVGNDYGEPTQEEVTKTSVWASVSPLRGRERFSAQQLMPEVTHKIIMRGGIDVNVQDIIVFDERKFRVESILDIDERGITKELICKEEK